MSVTGNPSVVTPVLFYDFNSPPHEDGSYWCLGHAFLEVNIGDKVRFGCDADDVMANGTVTGFAADGLLVGVQLDSWVPDVAAPPSPEQERNSE